MTHIADGTTSAFVAYEVKFAIGFHDCGACGKQTPPPPQAVLNELAEYHPNGGTVWPSACARAQRELYWKVPGWTSHAELGDICDDCSRAVADLLSSRKKSATGRSKDPGVSPAYAALDHALLRQCATAALELAEDGLLTAYPPPSVSVPTNSHGMMYGIPGSVPQKAFSTRHDYREGMLRRRIREIRCALLGVPFDE